MQHTEIERKFLVRSDGWRGKGNAKKIRQGYIARFQNRTVRVRLEGERGVLNIKYRNGGISRSEFEYEIPPDEAKALLDGLDPAEIIEKKRYTFEDKGNIWEVDEFEGANAGLIVAEIELADELQHFEKPEWLGNEVSHITRYLNAELSREPYSLWNKDEQTLR